MSHTFFTLLIMAFASIPMQAKFHTITRGSGIEVPSPRKSAMADMENVTDTICEPDDTICPDSSFRRIRCKDALNSDKGKYAVVRNRAVRTVPDHIGLPPLTIENLIREIRKNNLLYPDIVLAQAILETGWLTSPVCRKKHNLFGLTNPRTGKYYEFCHWTESVSAYYSKVQYRYDGGNYLLWLRDIGYAEAKDYVSALIRVLKDLRGRGVIS